MIVIMVIIIIILQHLFLSLSLYIPPNNNIYASNATECLITIC